MANLVGTAQRNFRRLREISRGIVVRWTIIFSGGQCGPRLRVDRGLRVRQGFHSGVQVGAGVCLGGDTTIDCYPGGLLTIGDGVTLTQGVFVGAIDCVTIGASAMIGEYCSIRDANHGMALGPAMKHQPMATSSISIGTDVWIRRGSATLAGMVVGDGAVIGANAVVTRNVDSFAIVGGSPARNIRTRA